MSALLDVHDLSVSFPNPHGGRITVVDQVSFSVAPGECVALVGESGSGKSLTALALMGLLPDGARTDASTRITMGHTALSDLSPRELRAWRGERIGMVFQDPTASLNPVLRVGDQLVEALRAHREVPRAMARTQAIALLHEVGIPDPAERYMAWPHQLSGGMRQRVMLAIALAAEPQLLLADEPTTALDVTVQAQILELLDRIRAERRMAVLLITHDLGLVAHRADRVLVMYAGRLVETAITAALFAEPRHPYTKGLLASTPRITGAITRLQAIPGMVPPPTRWPSGCRFHPRCPVAVARCATDIPPLHPFDSPRAAACWVAHAETIS
jgi:oligopeptide/dipeptide ABC transporter ATP-binding protein